MATTVTCDRCKELIDTKHRGGAASVGFYARHEMQPDQPDRLLLLGKELDLCTTCLQALDVLVQDWVGGRVRGPLAAVREVRP